VVVADAENSFLWYPRLIATILFVVTLAAWIVLSARRGDREQR